MTSIAANLQAVHARIARACLASGRSPTRLELIAVSKTWGEAAIRDAAAAGQRHFGENYVQEAVAKIEALAPLGLCWHFIGPIQSNKTALVARHFDWVHTIERLKIAQRLSAQRDVHRPPLKVCLQVNVSAEASKHGVSPEALLPLARAVAALPRLALKGLMCIPEPSEDPAVLAARFGLLAHLSRQLAAEGLDCPVLSMGMSQDLEAAIAAGATHVRVGSAIFGARPAPAGFASPTDQQVHLP